VFLTQDHLAIALEYVPGGNVLQYILKKGSLTENEVHCCAGLLISFGQRSAVMERWFSLPKA